MTLAALLPHRSLIRIGGADRLTFLQGLVSNDVAQASDKAVYAALLTPQGKFLHDMFIRADGDFFLIEGEAARAEDLLRRLTAYKLRAKVTFENLADTYDIWALWEDKEFRMDPRLRGDDASFAFSDPRVAALGLRVWMKKDAQPSGVTIADFALYDIFRLQHGVADGSRDLEIEKSTLAEGNFDFLNGIDWKKGCYVGQELTARMHYRGLAKKRLFPVRIDGPVPAAGTVLDNDSGEMRSSCGPQGLALLRVEAVLHTLDQKTPLTHGETKLWPVLPPWMKIDGASVNR